MSLFRESSLWVLLPPIIIIAHTSINKGRHTSFGVMWGGHNLAVGMGSDCDLRDLLKPHLSPALPHWKRTRVLAGHLDHNTTIANTLTF